MNVTLTYEHNCHGGRNTSTIWFFPEHVDPEVGDRFQYKLGSGAIKVAGPMSNDLIADLFLAVKAVLESSGASVTQIITADD